MTSSFLNIDDNIIKNQLLIQETSNEELTLQFPSSEVKKAVATVKPIPGFCSKTRDKKSSEKVFVNICTSDSVPSPENITNDELISILESAEPSDFKVPMSIGAEHKETDKKGEQCCAYDIIINPNFLNKINENVLFYNFFMVATMEGLDEKYGLDLEKNDFVILKNKKYHGQLKGQCIETRIPLVQELSGVRKWTAEQFKDEKQQQPRNRKLITEHYTTTSQLNSNPSKKSTPDYTIEKLSRGHKDAWKVHFNMKYPCELQDVDVNVGKDRLVLETEKEFADVFLPTQVSTKDIKGFSLNGTLELVVVLPIVL